MQKTRIAGLVGAAAASQCREDLPAVSLATQIDRTDVQRVALRHRLGFLLDTRRHRDSRFKCRSLVSLIRLSSIALLVCISSVAQGTGSGATPALENCKSQFDLVPVVSQFCVSVQVRDGYLTIVPHSPRIRLLDSFWATKPADSEKAQRTKAIKAELVAYVTKAVKKKRIYEYGIGPDDAKSPPDAVIHLEANSLAEALDRIHQSWPDCSNCDQIIANATADLATTLLDQSPLSSQTVCKDSTDVSICSSLTYTVDPVLKPDDLVQGQDGTAPVEVGFDFGVTPPLADGRFRSRKEILDWLRHNVQGRFWIEKEIHAYLEQWYKRLALSPLIVVSVAGQDRMIRIKEADRVGRLVLPVSATGELDPDAMKAAYVLLDHRQFTKFQNAKTHGDLGKPGQPQLYTVESSGLALCLPELEDHPCTQAQLNPDGSPVDGTPPAGYPTPKEQASLAYIDTSDLSDKQALLNLLGYSVTEMSESERAAGMQPTVDLVVQKLAPQGVTSSPDAGTPVPATGARTEARSVASTQDLRIAPRHLSPGDEPSRLGQTIEPVDPDEIKPNKAPRMDFLGGLTYRPGQSVREVLSGAVPTFRMAGLPASFSGFIGGDGAHMIGSASLDLDFVRFSQFHRRISIHFDGSSDVTNQRVLGGVRTDERRSGGNATSSFEVFHNLHRTSLQVTAEAGSQVVGHALPDSKSDSATIFYGQPGLNFLYATAAARLPFRMEITPQVKIASSDSTGGGGYRIWNVSGGLHTRIWNERLLSANVTGSFQSASTATPIYELPSLGGAESLRGFRSDLALGRRVWSVQPEVWGPIPGTLNSDRGFGGFLRQQLRLAAFFDLGAVSSTDLANTPGAPAIGTTPSQAGFRRGPGLGLRLIQGAVAINFDWAYGLGPNLASTRRSQFYLGFSKEGTF